MLSSVIYRVEHLQTRSKKHCFQLIFSIEEVHSLIPAYSHEALWMTSQSSYALKRLIYLCICIFVYSICIFWNKGENIEIINFSSTVWGEVRTIQGPTCGGIAEQDFYWGGPPRNAICIKGNVEHSFTIAVLIPQTPFSLVLIL